MQTNSSRNSFNIPVRSIESRNFQIKVKITKWNIKSLKWRISVLLFISARGKEGNYGFYLCLSNLSLALVLGVTGCISFFQLEKDNSRWWCICTERGCSRAWWTCRESPRQFDDCPQRRPQTGRPWCATWTDGSTGHCNVIYHYSIAPAERMSEWHTCWCPRDGESCPRSRTERIGRRKKWPRQTRSGCGQWANARDGRWALRQTRHSHSRPTPEWSCLQVIQSITRSFSRTYREKPRWQWWTSRCEWMWRSASPSRCARPRFRSASSAPAPSSFFEWRRTQTIDKYSCLKQRFKISNFPKNTRRNTKRKWTNEYELKRMMIVYSLNIFWRMFSLKKQEVSEDLSMQSREIRKIGPK